MKSILSIIVLIALCSDCTAQSLFIKKADQQVEITPTNYLEVGIKVSQNEECCNYQTLLGHLVSSSQDSISFSFDRTQITKELDLNSTSLSDKYQDFKPYKTIAKSDINYIIDFKSEKQMKRRKNLTTIGGALIFSGAITCINSLFFKENRKELVIIGGSQFIAGLTFGFSSDKPRKIFATENDPWKFD